jgi:hypothetical protein
LVDFDGFHNEKPTISIENWSKTRPHLLKNDTNLIIDTYLRQNVIELNDDYLYYGTNPTLVYDFYDNDLIMPSLSVANRIYDTKDVFTYRF